MIDLPPIDVPGILRQYGLRPDKGLGQNFLLDAAALRRVVEVAEVSAEDAVLEIGPGLGSLTRYLAAQARWVVAVELDKDLIPPLREILTPFPNVHVVEGDILDQDPSQLMSEATGDGGDYLVAANIPYYITSALLRHLLEADSRPKRMVLTVQREVARRITAAPGDMSLLALSVQVYGRPKVAAQIPAGSFYPAPNVDSAVVRIDLLPEPVIPPHLLDDFFRLAKAGFSQKRKTLRNSLSGGLAQPAAQVTALLEQAGIDPMRRAETLSLEEWGTMTHLYRQARDAG